MVTLLPRLTCLNILPIFFSCSSLSITSYFRRERQRPNKLTCVSYDTKNHSTYTNTSKYYLQGLALFVRTFTVTAVIRKEKNLVASYLKNFQSRVMREEDASNVSLIDIKAESWKDVIILIYRKWILSVKMFLSKFTHSSGLFKRKVVNELNLLYACFFFYSFQCILTQALNRY